MAFERAKNGNFGLTTQNTVRNFEFLRFVFPLNDSSDRQTQCCCAICTEVEQILPIPKLAKHYGYLR